MKNFDVKKKVLLLGIIGILLTIGVSYAVWLLSFSQASPNVATSACFSLTFEDSNDITLNSAYPLTDEEGIALTPYTFTITNHCGEYASYQVNLEVLNTTTMDSAYIKSEFNNTVKLVSDYPTTTKTLNNASTAYKLLTGFLDPNEEVTYTLKLWIDYNSTAEQSANKIYDSKITIASTYKGSTPTPMEDCEAKYGEGAAACNVIANADPENVKCLSTDANGMIVNPYSTMSDEEEPIICTMEDDYGTSYYLRGKHQDNNVKFANMCWKLMRVTGTGGIKLLYNGDLDVNGKCTTTSGEHTGFTGQTLSLSGNKVYGTSYTLEEGSYILDNTSTMNYSTDFANIIGKYTCGNTSTACSTLYYVVSSYGDSEGYDLKLNQSTNYASIGTTAFNYYYDGADNMNSASPALVGYMYNDTYPARAKGLSSNTNNYYYGETFSYNNGTYYLVNTVQFADVSNTTNRAKLNTHHYTCFNASDSTCSEMYFIYYIDQAILFYIKLNGNETGLDALNKMVNNNNINVKNSHIKGAVDWWYEQNIKNTEYESKLEDTVFCNDRTIDNIAGWSDTGAYDILQFHSYNNKYYLKCPNKRDAFTVSDVRYGNGSLKYSIGLLTTAEHSLTGNNSMNKTNAYYWSSVPYCFFYYYSVEGFVHPNGIWQFYDYITIVAQNFNDLQARPAISLKPGTKFIAGGDGSASNPYEVE